MVAGDKPTTLGQRPAPEPDVEPASAVDVPNRIPRPRPAPDAQARPDRRRRGPRAAARRLWHIAGANRLMTGLVVVGVVLRVGMMLAYYPAFGYFLDSLAYMQSAKSWTPNPIWPFGYPLMLAILRPTQSMMVVSVVQHLMGVAMGIAVYALLRRRGIPRLWAALAAAPVLLDSRELVVEQYLLSDTLFSALLVAALVLVLWSDRLTLWAAALSGVAFAAASLTRTIGQALPVLVLGYLVLRRVGWRPVVTFGVAFVVPMVAYVAWFHHVYGVYGVNNWTGRYLWARATTFVECDRPNFSREQLELCPATPVDQRLGPDSYLWGDDRPTLLVYHNGNDNTYKKFAVKAILAQPGDYVAVVAADSWHLLDPTWRGPQRSRCVHDLWNMPVGGKDNPDACTGLLLLRSYDSGPSGATVKATPLTHVLRWYSKVFTVEPWMLLVITLFILGSALYRPRRLRPRDALDAVLLAAIGVVLVEMSLAISAIDVRYALPLVPIAFPALALAGYRLRRPRQVEPASGSG